MPAQYPRTPKGSFPSVCGIGGSLGAPGLRLNRGQLGQVGKIGRMPIFAKPVFTGAFLASGVTRDGAGAALGSCTVDLFEAHAPGDVPRWVGRTVSDGSGNFSFNVSSNATLYWARAVGPTGLLAGVTLEFKAV